MVKASTSRSTSSLNTTPVSTEPAYGKLVEVDPEVVTPFCRTGSGSMKSGSSQMTEMSTSGSSLNIALSVDSTRPEMNTSRPSDMRNFMVISDLVMKTEYSRRRSVMTVSVTQSG